MDHPCSNRSGRPFQRVVVIGASAGGLQALQELLPAFTPACPAPILLVLHMHPQSKTSGMIHILKRYCCLPIKEADEKERLCAGTLYLAPANYHLLVEADQTLALSVDAKVNFSRPSIDMLFITAAEVYRQRLIAVLLSGASTDGVTGLMTVKAYGGATLAQLPETADSSLMPQSAIDAGCVDSILPPAALGAWLAKTITAAETEPPQESSHEPTE